MKNYHEMAESVLERRDSYIKERNRKIKKVTLTVSACCLCALLGIGVWHSRQGNGNITHMENPSQGTIQNIPDALQTEPAAPATESGEKFNISVDVGKENPTPAQSLTEQELYGAIGAYLPERPEGFAFESASCLEGRYSVIWYLGMDELDWYVMDYKEEYASRITSVEDTANYDLALYPIPRAESVPDALREIVNNPIFRAEELTLEAVLARAYKVAEAGDSNGYRMHFSVMYGDKLITVTAKGLSPQWLYEQLSKIES